MDASVGLPPRKPARNLLWGFVDALLMARDSGATYLVMRWCRWKWCAITVTSSCDPLKSMTSMTRGSSVEWRRHSLASWARNLAGLVTLSSQYVRITQGTLTAHLQVERVEGRCGKDGDESRARVGGGPRRAGAGWDASARGAGAKEMCVGG